MIPELDKKILAYVLGEKRIALQLQTIITTDYLHPEAQIFYRLLMLCFEKFRELPTPKVMEEQGGVIWNEQLSAVYTEIITISYDVREFPSDLDKLKTRYNTQLLLKLGKNIFRENWDGKKFTDLSSANKDLRRIVGNIDGIYSNRVFKEGSLAETVVEAWNNYKIARDNPELTRGIHLGLREFDKITNGLQPAELMLIGGESSSGKSALCMQMALNAWCGTNVISSTIAEAEKMEFNDSGINVLFFTIEMPYANLRRRIDCSLAGIQLYNLRDGKLTLEETERFKAALKFQRRYHKHFHIVDVPRGCTMAQIESAYIEKCFEYQPDLIIIDYISLMTPDRDEGSDWLNLGRLAEQMHEFCRQYNIAVISPVQLNRPPKQHDGGEPPSPDQHRVGRSIMLTQNANILLNIKTRKDEHLRPDMEVYISKMRDGEKGAFVLHKRLDIMRIYDDVPGWAPETYNVMDGYENDGD
ncbi:MAG: DnaB-like helicase C-terminal domain-containing protein [Patescibacteria group bacterium]|jgi:replicative DNA helicase